MYRETGKCSQQIAKILRNKHSVFVPHAAFFKPGKKFDGADSDHVLGNHFRAVSSPSCNQQNYAVNRNFRQASSKYLITVTPKTYPFFFSKIIIIKNFVGKRLAWALARGTSKVTCPRGKSTCPGRPDGSYFEPCIRPSPYAPKGAYES